MLVKFIKIRYAIQDLTACFSSEYFKTNANYIFAEKRAINFLFSANVKMLNSFTDTYTGGDVMGSMLEYKGYHAVIRYDADDDLFVGEVFGITDSLNFHGTSIEELKKMFAQSIDNYLELCEKINKNPDKEFKGSFNIRISPQLHKKAALAAAEQDITLNQYVTKAIEKSFEKEKVVKEIVIVMPEEKGMLSWNQCHNYEKDYSFDMFNNTELDFSKKEKLKYVRS